MQKINCAELQLKLKAIATKRQAIGTDFSSIPSGGPVNLPLARKIHAEVKQLLRLIEETEQIVGVRKLSAKTKEGVEVKFELKERLEYWRKFYKSHGVNWVKLPDYLSVSPEQAEAMEKLMAEGFNYMLIIPDGLVDEYREEIDPATGEKTPKNQKYADLHRIMSRDYERTYTSDNYDADGKFEGASDKRQEFRIILTKEVQNLEDDGLLKTTLNKSVEQMERVGGLLTQYEGLGESEYLIFARAYWEQSGKTKHLDEKGWTLLPGSRRPQSRRVPSARWNGGQLSFYSDGPARHLGYLGCRLAGSFPIAP